jgi:hypothetical protein
VPAGGWSSGRHVVTAVLVGPSGQTITAAVGFDVARCRHRRRLFGFAARESTSSWATARSSRSAGA